MITRRSRLALLIVPALALAAACTSGGDNSSGSAASGDQALKIGLLTQLSGPSKAAGTEAQNGAKLAVDVINGLNPSIPLPLASDAGLPNLGGAKVSLVVKDVTPAPEKDPAKAAVDPQQGSGEVQALAGAAVADLVSNQGVNALIGAYDPQVTEAASQRAERFEVPFINADSPATFLTDAGRDWFFRIGPTWRQAGQAFFSLARQQQPPIPTTKIAVLYAQDKAGQDVVTSVTELAKEGGLDKPNPVKTFGFKPDGSNAAAAYASVRAYNPDTLLLYSSPASVQPLLQAVATSGWKPKAAMSFSLGYVTAQTFDPAAAAVDGLMRSTSWSAEAAQRNPAAQAVTGLYQRRFNSPMTEAAASAFTAVMTAAQAVNNAGTLDAQKVRSALLSLDIPGGQTIMPWAGIQFDETHQNTLAQALVEQYHNRAFSIVYPSDAAARGAKAVYPAPASG
ncbi:MAG TPA: ABC transporter substrate-binding protein [Mycobacteriales bacterium]|jgi:branched-chain amino acid transport system substrate-binding protein